MTAAVAGFRAELRQLRHSPEYLLALVTAPMMTLILLSITRHAGREDLDSYAVLAPALIAMWGMALFTAGELVARERDNGTLEPLVATPAPLSAVVTGRIVAVVVVSLAGFAESWSVAWLAFQVFVPIEHPRAFVLTVIVTAAAMVGTSVAMSSVFILTRSARTFQNALSYPFYVLGGVMVPVALLPGWLEPISRAVFVSWSSDLLRDALAPVPVEHLGPRLLIVMLLGFVGHLAGTALLRGAVRRVRRTGSLGYV